MVGSPRHTHVTVQEVNVSLFNMLSDTSTLGENRTNIEDRSDGDDSRIMKHDHCHSFGDVNVEMEAGPPRRAITPERNFGEGPNSSLFIKPTLAENHIAGSSRGLPVHQRGDAVSSLVYHANARMRDPFYSCVGAISYLQNQVSQLQMQLAVAQAEILRGQMQQENPVADQQVLEFEHEKPFMMHNFSSIPQFMNFGSSSDCS